MTTVSKKSEARNLAQSLIKKKLAACVSLLPIESSFYFWKDRVQAEKEILLLIKTKKSLVPSLKKWVLALHSYQLPEFLVLSIQDGHPPYLQWILENTL